MYTLITINKTQLIAGTILRYQGKPSYVYVGQPWACLLAYPTPIVAHLLFNYTSVTTRCVLPIITFYKFFKVKDRNVQNQNELYRILKLYQKTIINENI